MSLPTSDSFCLITSHTDVECVEAYFNISTKFSVPYILIKMLVLQICVSTFYVHGNQEIKGYSKCAVNMNPTEKNKLTSMHTPCFNLNVK